MENRQYADFYRPTRLKDVVGQDHAVTMIKNMLAKPNMPNTILIHGKTGTAKTTLAEIIGNSVVGKYKDDLHLETLGDERGIEKTREIVRQAQFSPRGKYSVFIIDEIAEATKAAFMPMLGLLERPPKKSMFILVTDQPQKLPSTILGRCYKISLNDLTPLDLKQIVERVCKKEGIEFESKVIKYIINNAGEARTALQMLQAANDAQTDGGNYKQVLQALRATEGADRQAVKVLIGLYSKKPNIVFKTLLAEIEPMSFIQSALNQNMWLMREVFGGNSYGNDCTEMFKKYMKKPPKPDKITHVHNVLVNLRMLFLTQPLFEQKHLLVSRMGSLVYAL